jgi:phage gp29-like protein
MDYPLTVEEVIKKVQDAIESGHYETAKDKLEAYNNLSCPLCN